jgi:lysozyme family protein
MADYKKLIPHVLKWEGGWANDPNDKGGPTMKGITLNTYTIYCKNKGKETPTQTQLKNISQAEWEDVFKSMFWDKWQADKINNQSIANLVVDWLWASGQWGIKYP